MVAQRRSINDAEPDGLQDTKGACSTFTLYSTRQGLSPLILQLFGGVACKKRTPFLTSRVNEKHKTEAVRLPAGVVSQCEFIQQRIEGDVIVLDVSYDELRSESRIRSGPAG